MRALLLYMALVIMSTVPATAADLLIIQSHSNQQYDQTVRLIQNSCGKKNQTYIMGDYAEFDLGRIVREEQPKVVLAVGDRPLKESMRLRNTPVIHAMALSANEKQLRNNITGVTMRTSPEQYMKLFKKLGLRRTGVVYSRTKSGAYIEKAKKISAEYGVELVAASVNSPGESDNALSTLIKSGIDSIWLIPDTTAVAPEMLNSYFIHAQRANIPLISFSRAYLEKGALAALEASRLKMTEQICDKLSLMLGGTEPSDIPLSDISDARLYTNKIVAGKLGISLSGLDQLFSSHR
jgi:putative ABC transport system substrate-binding protein